MGFQADIIIRRLVGFSLNFKIVSESKGYTDFREYAYEASGLQSYIAFAIKVVMQGSKSNEVPFIKDFRAIALAL